MSRPPLNPSGSVVITIRLPVEVVEQVDALASTFSRLMGTPMTRSSMYRWILQPQTDRSVLETHAAGLASAPGRTSIVEEAVREARAPRPKKDFPLVPVKALRVPDPLAVRILGELASLGPRKSLPLLALSMRVGRPRRDLFQGALLELEREGKIVLCDLPVHKKAKRGTREAAVIDPVRGELLAARVTPMGVSAFRGKRPRSSPRSS